MQTPAQFTQFLADNNLTSQNETTGAYKIRKRNACEIGMYHKGMTTVEAGEKLTKAFGDKVAFVAGISDFFMIIILQLD